MVVNARRHVQGASRGDAMAPSHRLPARRIGVLASLALLILALDGILRDLGSIDVRILNRIQALRLESGRSLLELIDRLVSLPLAGVVWVTVFAGFAIARRWSYAMSVLLVPISVEAGIILFSHLVNHFGPDPSVVQRAPEVDAVSSFPSEAVVGTLLLCGIVGAACWKSTFVILRVGGAILAGLGVVLTSVSQLWLGVAWPTDVLAAYAFGTVVLLLLFAVQGRLAGAVDGLPLHRVLPSLRGVVATEQTHVSGWLEGGVAEWQREGRLSGAESARLRAELAAPTFQAVLPHIAAHVTIGVALTFPVSSVGRICYTLANLGVATARFLSGRIDRRQWRASLGVHSPLVMILTVPPILGEFAYLAARPIRANHLLLRVALDTTLVKVPWNLYERSGLRWILARSPYAIRQEHSRADVGHLLPPRMAALILGTIAVALFAADLVAQIIDATIRPTVTGWAPIVRIFDLGAESSLGTWFSVVSLFILAVLLAVIAWETDRTGRRFGRRWLVLSIIALGLSADEQARFHDPGGGIGTTMREHVKFLTGPLHYGWVLVAMLSAVVLWLCYREFLRALPRTTRRLFVAAAILYFGGEVGVEMINGWLVESGNLGLLYQTMTSVEEFLGMLGLVVALVALLLYIQRYLGDVRLVPRSEHADQMNPLEEQHLANPSTQNRTQGYDPVVIGRR